MDDQGPSRPILGIVFKVIATFLVIGNATCVKLVADRYPIGEIVFARAVFGLVPLLVWVAWRGGFVPMVRTSRLGAHALRTGIGVFAMVLYFASLGLLPLPDAMAISQSAPLIVVALAALMLGETVRVFRWTAVSVGFVGVFIIIWNYVGFSEGGAAEGSALGALLAFASAVSLAFATITLSTISRIEPVTTIVFYFSVMAALLALLTAPFGWKMPGAVDLLILAGVGITAGAGQLMTTFALRYADASSVAPFDYLQIVWALLFGWLIFAQLPNMQVLIGAAIVVASGLVVIWRERQLGLARSRERPPAAPVP